MLWKRSVHPRGPALAARTSWPVVLMFVGATACTQARTVDRPNWKGWPDQVPAARVPVRIATFNIEDGVDAPGSVPYKALVEILKRIDADVLGLNEVNADNIGDGGALDALAGALGMEVIATSFPNPFGDLGNAVLSRLEATAHFTQSAAEISGDAHALDLTRTVVAVKLAVPGSEQSVAVISTHLKSAEDDTDFPSFFRRAVDAERTAGAAEAVKDADVAFIMGDMNYEPDQVATPQAYGPAPSGMPGDYALGSDITALMAEDALSGSPFTTFSAHDWSRLDLTQRDGTRVSRPVSGRLLDHVLVDPRAAGVPVHGEIYSCLLDTPAMPGITDGPPISDTNDCNRVSDHLPVVFEVALLPAD